MLFPLSSFWQRIGKGMPRFGLMRRFLGSLALFSFVLLSATAASGAEVTLTWNANTESDLAGYNIYCGTSSRNYDFYVDAGTQNQCTVANLEGGRTYFFAATARDLSGNESGFSDEVSVYLPNETADTDGDGLTDDDEKDIYGTDPNRADTDGDGMRDGEEQAFWGNAWNADYDGDGVVNLLDEDSDADGVLDGMERNAGSDPADPADPGSVPQQGSFNIDVGEVSINHSWTRVTFSEPFDDPIVVAKSLSRNGSDPAVIHIRNVDQNGFEIRVREWNYLNGSHCIETVGYLVLERGSWLLSDGTMVEAGRFETNWTSSFGWIAFNEPFRAVPVVITVVSSCNGTDVVTTRMRNVTTEGFEFRMQEQESKNQSHPDETILYVAWEPSAGNISNLYFEISTTPNAATHSFYGIQFDRPLANIPVFLADMQTANGLDPANLRWRNKDKFGVDVQVDEEQSKTTETSHAAEVVGYMVFDLSR